jgi:hypothetical protein
VSRQRSRREMESLGARRCERGKERGRVWADCRGGAKADAKSSLRSFIIAPPPIHGKRATSGRHARGQSFGQCTVRAWAKDRAAIRHTRSGPGSIGAGAMSMSRVVCCPWERIAAACGTSHRIISEFPTPSLGFSFVLAPLLVGLFTTSRYLVLLHVVVSALDWYPLNKIEPNIIHYLDFMPKQISVHRNIELVLENILID